MTRRLSPAGAVALGLGAGVVGTGLMTAWQELSARLQGGDEDATETPKDPWEAASAPAKVARRIARGLFETDIPASQITTTTNIMHWSYGTSWGAVYGVLAGTRRRSSITGGLVFGTGVWTMSYIMLVPTGLYAAPWSYPPKELALDWSYHAAYGVGTALGFAALARA